ncbi:hypothetical protein GCM10007216_30680 [Thalassobacillus devorans]|uniref:Uncharacterized protein n=1 Tax=Thalassobacillus devorans TaxID=279813 RepID=A0ABQ1PIK3_9BACI|nr:hypothetical protein [Thalassobacillus devorans]NIK30028.1 hypothetical protein [Thalassobacillus devorans]GGC97760.1 hypothetical protein GCM10007216_30680 [Thalassobacillus devorans]
MTQTLNKLGLNDEQAQILYSWQYRITEREIENGNNYAKKALKREWLQDWADAIDSMIEEQSNGKLIIRNKKDLLEKTKYLEYNCGNFRTPLFLILFEATLFTAYFPVNPSDMKKYKKIKFKSNSKEVENELIEMARALKLDKKLPKSYQASFKKSVNSISGLYKNLVIGGSAGAVAIALTAGFATPYIAALAAPSGLAGAAAVNAGLATLGGGAIAAGGTGMAGGIAVIVGGGAVIGGPTGLAAGKMLSKSSDLALIESAKIQVVMKEIVLLSQKDVRFAQELIAEQKEAIKLLEIELHEMKSKNEKNSNDIVTLRKSIKYMKESYKYNEKMLEF